ncbi:MAG: hypothetical protein CSA51_02010 [Gammaproteobacteria bacterium]|nr:MAG: hypothetical protein CSA51_02010 [Gammaproteobacteria bacterium]
MPALNKLWLRWLIVALFSSVLVACSGLPDNLVLRYEKIPRQLKEHEEKLKGIRQAYDQRKKSDDWGFAEPYANRGKWEGRFQLARNSLTRARAMYEKELKQLYERDKPEDTTAFSRQLAAFDALLARSLADANYPNSRWDHLVQVRKNAPLYHRTASDALSEAHELQKKLKARGQKVKKDYSHKSEDLDKRMAKMDDYVNRAEKQHKAVQTQFDKHKNNSSADYSILGDARDAMLRILDDIRKYEATTRAKLDELYTSYTRILTDQKIDYYIQISRASWCERETCGEGSRYGYAAKRVDGQLFEFFDSYTGDLIATLRSHWGRPVFRLQIPDKYWNGLNIGKRTSMSRSHTEADYWVEKTFTRSFHKYLDIANEKQTRSGWVEVKEEAFWQQLDNLGMAIFTKPYGYFKEDSLTRAEPVGLAMVASPKMVNGHPTGMNQYGEWKTDSSGTSFWHYYGMYAFLNALMPGGRGYSYHDWDVYHRRQRGKPYYGENREYGTYGSHTYSRGKGGYGSSEYARRYPGQVKRTHRSRGNRGKASSIRGAGPSVRSRGPAGGGK